MFISRTVQPKNPLLYPLYLDGQLRNPTLLIVQHYLGRFYIFFPYNYFLLYIITHRLRKYKTKFQINAPFTTNEDYIEFICIPDWYSYSLLFIFDNSLPLRLLCFKRRQPQGNVIIPLITTAIPLLFKSKLIRLRGESKNPLRPSLFRQLSCK